MTPLLRRAAPLLCLLCTVLPACFPEPAERGPTEPPPAELQVRDRGGALFETTAVPRDPELVLSFAQAPSALPPIKLMRGLLHPALLERLSGSRLRTLLSERAVALQVERRGRALHVLPTSALTAGERYTLFWSGVDESVTFLLVASDHPVLGAGLSASWPAAGEVGVARNLKRALLQFDGRIEGELAAAITLRDAAGSPLPVSLERTPCELAGLAPGDCVWLTPHATLVPGAHELRLEPGIRAATGAAIAAASAPFVVGEEDLRAPAVRPLRCALDESVSAGLCARVQGDRLSLRGALDEPAWVSLTSTGAGGAATYATLAFAGEFALPAIPLAPAATSLLRLVDLAGNSYEQRLAFAPGPSLATLSIDEVRHDPLGKEPAQEYVELLNYGETAVSLMGFSLSTDPHEAGRSLLGPLALAPGERLLVVGPDFDPLDLADGPLPRGVRLARLTSPLSLANGGALLVLRDAAGQRLSSAQFEAALVEGQCSARFAEDLRRGDRAAFELDPEGGCTPGRASFERP